MSRSFSRKSLTSRKSSGSKKSLTTLSAKLSSINESIENIPPLNCSLFIINISNDRLLPILREYESCLQERKRRVIVWIPLESLMMPKDQKKKFKKEPKIEAAEGNVDEPVVEMKPNVTLLKDKIEQFFDENKNILEMKRQIADFDILEKWENEEDNPSTLARPETDPPTLVEDANKINTHLIRRGTELTRQIFIEDAPVDSPELYVVLTGVYDIDFIRELIQARIPVLSLIKLYPRTNRQKRTKWLDDFWDQWELVKSEKMFETVACVDVDVPVLVEVMCRFRHATIDNQFAQLLFDIQDLSRQHKNYLKNAAVISLKESAHIPKEMKDKNYNQMLEGIANDRLSIDMIFDALTKQIQDVQKPRQLSIHENESGTLETISSSVIVEEKIDVVEVPGYQPLIFVVNGKTVIEHNDRLAQIALDLREDATNYNRQLQALQRFSNIYFNELTFHQRNNNTYFLNKLKKYLDHTQTDSEFMEVHLNILQLENLRNGVKPVFKDDTEEFPEKIWQQHSLQNVHKEKGALILLHAISDFYINYRNQTSVPMKMYTVPPKEFQSQEHINNDPIGAEYVLQLLSMPAVLQLLEKWTTEYDNRSCYYSALTDVNILRFWNDPYKVNLSTRTYQQVLPTVVCLRDFNEYVKGEIARWLAEEEQEYERLLASIPTMRPSLALEIAENEKALKAIAEEDFIIRLHLSIKLKELNKRLQAEELRQLEEEALSRKSLVQSAKKTPSRATLRRSVRSSKTRTSVVSSASKATITSETATVSAKELVVPAKKLPFFGYDFGNARMQLNGIEHSFQSIGVSVKVTVDRWLYRTSYLRLEANNLGVQVLCNYSFNQKNKCEKNLSFKEFVIVARNGTRIAIERNEVAKAAAVPSTSSQIPALEVKSETSKDPISSKSSILSKKSPSVHSLPESKPKPSIEMIPPEITIEFDMKILMPHGLQITKELFKANANRLVQKWMNTSRDNEIQRTLYPNGFVVIYYANGFIRVLKYNGTIFEIDSQRTQEWKEGNEEEGDTFPPAAGAASSRPKSKLFTMSSGHEEQMAEEESVGDVRRSNHTWFEFEIRSLHFLRPEVDTSFYKMIMPDGLALDVRNDAVVYEYPTMLRCRDSFDYITGEMYIRREDGVSYYYTNDSFDVLFYDKTLITTEMSTELLLDDIDMEIAQPRSAGENQQLRRDMKLFVDKVASFSSQENFLKLNLKHKIQHENYASLDCDANTFNVEVPGKLGINYVGNLLNLSVGDDFAVRILEDKVEMSANTCINHNKISKSSFNFKQSGEENFFELQDFVGDKFSVSWFGEVNYKSGAAGSGRFYCPMGCKDCYCNKFAENERCLVIKRDLSGYEVVAKDYLNYLRKSNDGKMTLNKIDDKLVVLEEHQNSQDEFKLKDYINLKKFDETVSRTEVNCAVTLPADKLPPVLKMRCYMNLKGDLQDVVEGIAHMTKFLKRSVDEFQTLSVTPPVATNTNFPEFFNQLTTTSIEIFLHNELEKIRLQDKMKKRPKPTAKFAQFMKDFAYKKERLDIYKDMIRYRIRPYYKDFYDAGGHIKLMDVSPYKYHPKDEADPCKQEEGEIGTMGEGDGVPRVCPIKIEDNPLVT